MNTYELTFIVKGEITEEKAAEIADKIQKAIEREGGQILESQNFGKRQLAYPIQRQTTGSYFTLLYNLSPQKTPLLLSEIKLEPHIIRHLIISLKKEKINPNQLKPLENKPNESNKKPNK